MAIAGSFVVKVTPEVLANKAEVVSKNITAMETCFTELQDLAAKTSAYWIGEAGELHRQKFRDESSNMKTVIKRLQEHPIDLLQMSENYAAAEKLIKETAQTLPGDIIE